MYIYIYIFMYAQNRRGCTPLLLAAESGQPEMTKALLSAGSALHLCDAANRSALELALHNGHLETLGVLLAQVSEKAGYAEQARGERRKTTLPRGISRIGTRLTSRFVTPHFCARHRFGSARRSHSG